MTTRKKAEDLTPPHVPMLNWRSELSGMGHKVLVSDSEAGRFIIAKGGRELIHPDGHVDTFDPGMLTEGTDPNTEAIAAAEFAVGQYLERKEAASLEDTQPAASE